MVYAARCHPSIVVVTHNFYIILRAQRALGGWVEGKALEYDRMDVVAMARSTCPLLTPVKHYHTRRTLVMLCYVSSCDRGYSIFCTRVPTHPLFGVGKRLMKVGKRLHAPTHQNKKPSTQTERTRLTCLGSHTQGSGSTSDPPIVGRLLCFHSLTHLLSDTPRGERCSDTTPANRCPRSPPRAGTTVADRPTCSPCWPYAPRCTTFPSDVASRGRLIWIELSAAS